MYNVIDKRLKSRTGAPRVVKKCFSAVTACAWIDAKPRAEVVYFVVLIAGRSIPKL